MKRYPAYDPPEYVDWKADEGLLEAYRGRIDEHPDRSAIVHELGVSERLELYRGLVRFRLHDIMLQRWVKQGVISKAWLGTGEEAVTIGAVHALRREGRDGDYVGPMIRNNGACHEMGMSIADMLRAYLATADSPTHGRDLHVGDLDCGIVTPISMVGGLAPVMNGFALAFKRRREDRVTLTWVGDGATKNGEVHEALNFAAVMRLPAIVVIQNNQVALGTRFDQHHPARDFSEWGRAYGATLRKMDGNHVLDVYASVRLARAQCAQGDGPVFLEAETFRMGGHATHDVREARETFPAELFEAWGRRDPIGTYEEYLARDDRELAEVGYDVSGPTREARNREVLLRVEEEVNAEVEAAGEKALESRRERMPKAEDTPTGVYA